MKAVRTAVGSRKYKQVELTPLRDAVDGGAEEEAEASPTQQWLEYTWCALPPGGHTAALFALRSVGGTVHRAPGPRRSSNTLPSLTCDLGEPPAQPARPSTPPARSEQAEAARAAVDPVRAGARDVAAAA